eukprot:6513058-Pyramimonas_sp.AAC.1
MLHSRRCSSGVQNNPFSNNQVCVSSACADYPLAALSICCTLTLTTNNLKKRSVLTSVRRASPSPYTSKQSAPTLSGKGRQAPPL